MLFKFLFPAKAKQIESLQKINKTITEEYNRREMEIHALPKMSSRNLLRENLGAMAVEIDGIEKKPGESYPPHPLSDLSDDELRTRLAQVEELFKNPMLWEYKRWLINKMGNKLVRYSRSQEEDVAARFTINGIATLTDEIEQGHKLFEERNKPPEDYDRFEVI